MIVADQPPAGLGEAELRLSECLEQEQRLDDLWQRLLAGVHQLRPDELERVVDERVRAAARTAAAAAELELASAGAAAPRRAGSAAALDQEMLRRLLDGLALDRSTIARSLVRDVLEMLCSIALDLEVTERLMGNSFNGAGRALADLRGHIVDAAARLRAMPQPAAPLHATGEQLAIVVRRSLNAYAGSLDVTLEWHGGEPERAESTAALLWVLQELVHHLHSVVAGRCSVDVHVEPAETTVTVRTPVPAFATGDVDPDWLLRSRLRLQLAGGAVQALNSGGGTSVAFSVP